jgi:hypothetical protein
VTLTMHSHEIIDGDDACYACFVPAVSFQRFCIQ